MPSFFDRVLETTTTIGTGTFTLAGPPITYRSFSVGGNGKAWQYVAVHETLNEWEIGEGTWTTPNQLSRTTVFLNSAGNTAQLAFSSGNKIVHNDLPAEIINLITDVAPDKVLGRESPTTGLPEQITCTPFARSILDDATAEAVRTTIGAAAVGGGGYTDEQAQDAVGPIMTGEEGVTVSYNDSTPRITVTGNLFSSMTVGMVPPPGSAGTTKYLREDGTWVAPAAGGTPQVNVQVFTSSGTWTKPAGATATSPVDVLLVGGGGGGGSGRRGGAASARYGGGGGAGASYTRATCRAGDLGATMAVTVGVGGSGGASVSTDGTNGNPGGYGGAAEFKASGGADFLYAGGGQPGAGGTAAAAAGGPASASSGMYAGGAGADGVAGGTAGNGAAGVIYGASGGGGGAGFSSANAPGTPGASLQAPGTGPLAIGYFGGIGGLGGTAPSGAGTTPFEFGGGGGGGGAGVNSSSASGAGGTGASGVVVVTTYL